MSEETLGEFTAKLDERKKDKTDTCDICKYSTVGNSLNDGAELPLEYVHLKHVKMKCNKCGMNMWLPMRMRIR